MMYVVLWLCCRCVVCVLNYVCVCCVYFIYVFLSDICWWVYTTQGRLSAKNVFWIVLCACVLPFVFVVCFVCVMCIVVLLLSDGLFCAAYV